MPELQSIGVLIVEDEALIRAGLKLALRDNPKIRVLGEAADGVSAVTGALKLKPDVILMDIGLPRMNGIETSRLIKKVQETRIIMFTSHDDEESILAALSAGADGYCRKDISAEHLLEAITAVADGVMWFDESIARKMWSAGSQGRLPLQINNRQEPPGVLSSVELNVLALIVEGLSPGEISERLDMTGLEVNSHLQSTTYKLARTERASGALAQMRQELSPEGEELRRCSSCQRDLHRGFEICPFDGSPLQDAVKDTLIGRTFADRYEIISVIGRGGMSIVYKAKHKFMKRLVAIKILHPHLVMDLNNLKRFRLEAEAASALAHENIIRIYDFGLSADGEAFLVMDYLDGLSLQQVVKRELSLSIERSLHIFLQICDGLEHAHSKGVVHRDLKPSNVVLVKEPDGSESVRIVDFGIAKIGNSGSPSITTAGEVYGSPGYMSPEQCLGQVVDQRSDIYALGCVMYETLSGRPPFRADNAFNVMNQQVAQSPQSLCELIPELPEDLEQIILKSLAKDPAERQQSASQLKGDLIAFQRSYASARTPPDSERASSGSALN
jgi:DNA-binding NarL/FixJ family response regulator/tRNA A-37 threonylcarbamoyl transferase component Bud32